jgi:hypothetical protein
MTNRQIYLLGQLRGLSASKADTEKLRWELLLQLLETIFQETKP